MIQMVVCVCVCVCVSHEHLLLLQSTRAKQKVTDQKIQQAEEAFSHAKQLYDEITDELYEELPAFYDR